MSPSKSHAGESSAIKAGDKIKVLRVPPALRKKPDPEPRLHTLEVFKKCVGKTFVVQSVNEIGWLELELPNLDSVWIEPGFVTLVARRKP